jgi:hypothetical protein
VPTIHLFVTGESLFHPPALHAILERRKREIVGATVFPVPPHSSLRKGVLLALALDGWRALPRMARRWLAHRVDCIARSPPNFSSVRAVFAYHAVEVSQFRNPNDPDCVRTLRARGVEVLLNMQPWYLKSEALAAPRITCLNVHTGALPKYRGVEPVVRALLAGDPMIGVSVHTMTESIDEGRLLAQRLVPRERTVFDCYRATFAVVPDLVEDALAEIERDGVGTELPDGHPYFGPLKSSEVTAFRKMGLRYL